MAVDGDVHLYSRRDITSVTWFEFMASFNEQYFLEPAIQQKILEPAIQ